MLVTAYIETRDLFGRCPSAAPVPRLCLHPAHAEPGRRRLTSYYGLGTYRRGVNRIYIRVPRKGRKECWSPLAGLPACATRTPPLGGWVGYERNVCVAEANPNE
jgi:hypothetical protein